MKHKVLFKLFSLISVALFLSIVGAKAEELGSYYDATDCATVTEIPVVECEALIALYNSTDGANWNNNTGWNVTNTPCSWYGVTCGGGHVLKLNLSNNQLTGSIPPELCDLSKLECIDLSNNQFSGPIPACLDHLPPCSNPAGLIFFSSCTGIVEDICIYIAENGQATPVVKRTGGDGAVSVDIITDDITNTLSWSDGDTGGKAFTIEITDEILIIRLYNPTGGAELGLPNIAVIINIPPTSCNQVTEIPKKECQALLALYNSTDGVNWENNMGWNVTQTPCSWFGVTCQDKHVTGLTLEDNNLKGAISKKLSKLKELRILLLNNNKLSGNIPNSLMKLKNLLELDLNDNCLNTKVSKKLKKLLDDLNPGWDKTQTSCFGFE